MAEKILTSELVIKPIHKSGGAFDVDGGVLDLDPISRPRQDAGKRRGGSAMVALTPAR
jgi:hypothetical protein